MSLWGDFSRTLSAEALKIRKTLALWLVSVLPAAPAGLQLLLQLSGNNRPPAQVDPWLWMGHGVMLIWTMFILPLFVALESGLLAGVEHGANGWKHLFALPVRRGPVFVAKITMVVVLVGAAHVMLLFWTVVAGGVLAASRPDLGLTWLPSPVLLIFIAASFIGSWLMVTIHAWIGLRWSSLVLSVGIAIVALVVNLSLIDSDLRRFFPWFVPVDLAGRILRTGLDQAALGIPRDAMPSLITGSVGGLLVGVMAVVMLARRDVR